MKKEVYINMMSNTIMVTDYLATKYIYFSKISNYPIICCEYTDEARKELEEHTPSIKELCYVKEISLHQAHIITSGLLQEDKDNVNS